jgi:imidazoleglycerol-phosphate dehydratase
MTTPNPDHRLAQIARKTAETDVSVTLDLDAAGPVAVDTGLGFLDHMLQAFGRHGRFGLQLSCRGDLQIDDHHTVEDCALALGQAVDAALGERRGVERFADAFVAMDEALARCVIDLSGRGHGVIDLGIRRERLGAVAGENLTHFFTSFAQASRNTVHLDVLRGDNDHHRAEAAFKALAVALRRAVARTGDDTVPSTKGVLA